MSEVLSLAEYPSIASSLTLPMTTLLSHRQLTI